MVESEFFGLPEYVVNTVTTEAAGNGNVRIYNYVKRGNLLVPRFMCLMAAADLVVASREVESAANHVFQTEAVGMRMGAH